MEKPKKLRLKFLKAVLNPKIAGGDPVIITNIVTKFSLEAESRDNVLILLEVPGTGKKAAQVVADIEKYLQKVDFEAKK